MSGELEITSALTDENTTEAARRFALYSVERELVSCKTPLDFFGGINSVRPGLCFALTFNDRFDYASKKMILVDYTVNHVDQDVKLTLWG
jgi:hypothetical protein